MASFLLNHNVPPRLGDLLRAHGHSAISAREARLASVTDRELLLFAGNAGLTLITSDQDFVRLHHLATIRHAGILRVAPIPLEPWELAAAVAEAIDRVVGSGQSLTNRLLRLSADGEWREE